MVIKNRLTIVLLMLLLVLLGIIGYFLSKNNVYSPKRNEFIQTLLSPFDIQYLTPSNNIYTWESEIGRFIAFWGSLEENKIHYYVGEEKFIDYIEVLPLNTQFFSDQIQILSFDKKSELIYVKSPLTGTSFSTLTPVSAFWNNVDKNKPILFTVNIGNKNKINTYIASQNCPDECKSRWNTIKDSIEKLNKLYDQGFSIKISKLAILDSLYQ